MGVRGLKKFVFEHGEFLLQPYSLSDTTLIIDGCNFCCFMYSGGRVCNPFGGDYDSIHCYFTEIIRELLKCSIRPIILFDGCPPESKLQTIRRRREQSVQDLRYLYSEPLSKVFYPMFLFEVFLQVLNETNVEYVQLYEEADREIAALGKFLNCPVLSDDSDFFIYDVDYIPLKTVDFTSKSNLNGSSFIQCRLYRSEHLLKQFPGLKKSVLPLVGLLGNDFAHVNFYGFFKHDLKNFVDVFRRLQTGSSLENIIKEILQSLEERDVKVGELEIRNTLKHYDIPNPLSFSRLHAESRMTYEVIPEVYGRDLCEIPKEILELYEKCKLSTFVISLIRYGRCNLFIQAEDVNQDSPHFSSIPIIREIYKVLRVLTGAPEEITVNMRVKSKLVDVKLVCQYQDYTSRRLAENVIKEGEDTRCGVFCDALGLNGSDRGLLKKFDEDWILLVTSIIYWTRNVKKVNETHLRAVLFMALYNYIKVGHKYERRGSTERAVLPSFSDLVKRVPEEEYQTFVHRCITLEKSDRVILTQRYFVPAVHVFASLQSVLFYVRQFNIILNEPFHDLKMSRFYSGTFLLTLFSSLTEEEGFAEVTFAKLPNMLEAYRFLEKSLSYYLPTGLRRKAIR